MKTQKLSVSSEILYVRQGPKEKLYQNQDANDPDKERWKNKECSILGSLISHKFPFKQQKHSSAAFNLSEQLLVGVYKKK